MKNLLFFLVFSLFVSCESKKEKSNTKEVTTKKLTEQDKETIIREKINNQYLIELSKCHQKIDAVTNFNGKTEFWRICKNEDGNRIIQINSHKEDTLFEEVYFEKGDELVYAEESIKYMPINHYTLQPWICQFYTKNGKLVSMMSLGHGKTEDEKWNPEVIFEMHRNRIEELNKIEKE